MILLPRLIDEAFHSREGSTERQILAFLYSKKESIRTLPFEEFLKQTYLSKSTFQRFMKSLGLTSYAQFKTNVYREMEYLAQELEIRRAQNGKINETELKKKLNEARKIVIYGSPEFLDVFFVYVPYVLYLYQNDEVRSILFYDPELLDPDDVAIFGSVLETPDLLWLQNEIYFQSSHPFQAGMPCYSVFIGRKGPAHQIKADTVFSFDTGHSMAESIYELCRLIEYFVFTI